MKQRAHSRLVLIKHAKPRLDATPARDWTLGTDGEQQARCLAAHLREFVPCRLSSSPEPKAVRTCKILVEELGGAMNVVEAFREIDRSILPLMSAAAHQRANAPIFTNPGQRVMGRESACEAFKRFDLAIRQEVKRSDDRNLVVVAHGTVISLFVAEYNDLNAFDVWKRLQCPSIVILDASSFGVLAVTDRIPGQSTEENA